MLFPKDADKKERERRLNIIREQLIDLDEEFKHAGESTLVTPREMIEIFVKIQLAEEEFARTFADIGRELN